MRDEQDEEQEEGKNTSDIQAKFLSWINGCKKCFLKEHDSH